MPLFGSENWLYIAVIGLVVGLLARLLKPGRDRMGLILTTLLGIGGGAFKFDGGVGQRLARPSEAFVFAIHAEGFSVCF